MWPDWSWMPTHSIPNCRSCSRRCPTRTPCPLRTPPPVTEPPPLEAPPATAPLPGATPLPQERALSPEAIPQTQSAAPAGAALLRQRAVFPRPPAIGSGQRHFAIHLNLPAFHPGKRPRPMAPEVPLPPAAPARALFDRERQDRKTGRTKNRIFSKKFLTRQALPAIIISVDLDD